MWDSLLKFFRKREAREFSEHAAAWHKTCQSISEAYVDVLGDAEAAQPDIGVVLDKTDRMLFSLRDHLSALRSPLARRNQGLAVRVLKATERLFELRNQTTRFLIRSQGPTPPFLRETPHSPGLDQAYYYKAMQEVGFEARQAARDLSKELKSIWSELRLLVGEADELVRG